MMGADQWADCASVRSLHLTQTPIDEAVAEEWRRFGTEIPLSFLP